MKSLDDGLKQRLIGAIVLLALAVIFLPVLFERHSLEPVDTTSQIPPAPEIVPVEVDEPVVPDVVRGAPDPDEMFEPPESEAVAPEPEPPSLKPTGEPKSWVLQVASFRMENHAEAMRDKLNRAGFTAFSRESEYKNGTVNRVFVGPKLSKNALLEDKAKIDEQFDVDSLVLEFTP